MNDGNYIEPVGLEVFERVSNPESHEYPDFPNVPDSASPEVTESMDGKAWKNKPIKTKNKKETRKYVFITTMTTMKHEDLFQPKTQVRAFQSYYDAKEEHISNIQRVMDMISGEDDKQFFFNKYGRGNSNIIYHFDILGQAEYILTLTSTRVKQRTQLSTQH